MTRIDTSVVVDRPPAEVMPLFDGPVSGWLPVIVGPDEESWRTQTLEGPVRVHVVVHPGEVWILPDGTHRRTLTVEPDRTAFRDLLVAGLTPRVEGHLRVETGEEAGRTRLVFEGETRSRSRVTTALERLVIGDPLVRSGIDTLLQMIAGQLTTAPFPPDGDGRPRRGPVRVPIPRRR